MLESSTRVDRGPCCISLVPTLSKPLRTGLSGMVTAARYCWDVRCLLSTQLLFASFPLCLVKGVACALLQHLE